MAIAVAALSSRDKIREAILRSKKYLPAALAAQVEAFLTPENLALMTATVAVWAGSHFFGVGEVVDVGLLLVGAFFVGWSIEAVVRGTSSSSGPWRSGRRARPTWIAQARLSRRP
jgi:hypothetical protein